jgi:hypothetical protein
MRGVVDGKENWGPGETCSIGDRLAGTWFDGHDCRFSPHGRLVVPAVDENADRHNRRNRHNWWTGTGSETILLTALAGDG